MSRSLTSALVCLLSLPAFAVPPPASCPKPVVAATSKQADARAREAAHKGFTYLAGASIQWTKQHNCFGCHVQAVTMEALTAARHHQYDVKPSDIEAMVKALQLGVTAGGHATGVAFEGAAWARYDRYMDDKQTAQLLKYADELMRIQAEDGSIRDDDARLPITGGTMQTTYQAAQTWRQAYARTANDKYLSPMRKAERYLTRRADGWRSAEGVYIQDLNFALLGLASAGVTRSEPASVRLQKLILSKQQKDGGWALQGNESDAFATGQSIYALKVAGFSDTDDAIQAGLTFLLGKQSADGAWRTAKSGQNGSEKGETMWAVLGLVTVDVASIAVSGLTDGQHVSDTVKLDASAIDNQSGGISELALFVDDVKVGLACGPKLTHELDTRTLTAGKHTVDLVAVNAKGKQSRRRFEVFSGDVFLTEVGAVFDEQAQATRVSLRNIADPKHQGQVELEVWSVEEKTEAPKTRVYTTRLKSEPGAAQFEWKGQDEQNKPLPRGRYLAKVHFKDGKGGVRQTETALFLHDSERVQRQTYGEVEGSLQLSNLGIGSANTFVDLVDDRGNVVQTARSTEQGNYRFKNVKPGEYKVRARKQGYAPLESSVSTSAGAPAAKADMKW